ncbi:unnamed protein product [Orchesella dallaii]|uniref:Lipoprotein n=1 Tax=Orchesella dallaii TaxID=48710 RepID=A0ABP1PVD4_9HEXA
MKKKLAIFYITIFLHIGCTVALELPPYNMPKYLYASREKVTVSGNEAGGLFAQLIHFAHSKYIKGAGIFSSTFSPCGSGDGNTANFVAACTSAATSATQSSVDTAVAKISTSDTQHVIDSVKYLRDSYVYVYAGLLNTQFTPTQQLLPISLYEKYIASPYYIKTRVQNSAESLRVINAVEGKYAGCSGKAEADGTISKDCTNLSVPAEALSFLLGGKYSYFVNPFYNNGYKHLYLQPLRSFNQTEFTSDLTNHGLDDVGYFYVPHYCQHGHSYGSGHHGYGSHGYGSGHHGYGSHGYESGHHGYGSHGHGSGHHGYGSHGHGSGHHGYGSHGYGSGHHGTHGYCHPCKVHVYFHGCGEGREFKGTSFVTRSNYLEVAEANNIIMLFPQTHSTATNPTACWDVIGFSGPTFATKNGPQILAVWRMIERLLYLPRDGYTTSGTSYSTPATSYSTPATSYSTPATSSSTTATSYSTPATTYSTPTTETYTTPAAGATSTPYTNPVTGYARAGSSSMKPMGIGNRMMMSQKNPSQGTGLRTQSPASKMQKSSTKMQNSSSQMSSSTSAKQNTSPETPSSSSKMQSSTSNTQSKGSNSQTKQSTS